MFDKFGEFDSVEELNKAAAEKLAAGNEEELVVLAMENGIDKEDAEDYFDGCFEELANIRTSALGKLKVEAQDLQLKGVTEDWKDLIVEECMKSEELCVAVRRKGRRLAECMAGLIKFSFENKVQVSDKIVSITKVTHNGKTVPMQKPLYLGFPNKAEVKKIVREYYLG